MRDKLQSILSSYDEITAKLSDPGVLGDQREYARLAKEHAEMTSLAATKRARCSGPSRIRT
jgi:peptide chain release factor 1